AAAEEQTQADDREEQRSPPPPQAEEHAEGQQRGEEAPSAASGGAAARVVALGGRSPLVLEDHEEQGLEAPAPLVVPQLHRDGIAPRLGVVGNLAVEQAAHVELQAGGEAPGGDAHARLLAVGGL